MLHEGPAPDVVADRVCVTCARLCGCHLLNDEKGGCNQRFVINPSTPCSSWEPQQDLNARKIRAHAIVIGGTAGLVAIHQLRRLSAQRQPDMQQDHQDFRALLRPNMSSGQRELQLRYQTDDEGNVPEENPVPRISFELKDYLTRLGVPKDVSMFWLIDQCIKEILKIEKQEGLISRSSTKTASTPQEITMPAPTPGRKVSLTLRRFPEAGGPQAGSPTEPTTEAVPATTKAPRGRPPKANGGPKGPGLTQEAAAPAATPTNTSVDAIADAVIAKFRTDIIGDLDAAIKRAVTDAKNEITASIAELRDTSVNLLTLHWDLTRQAIITYVKEEDVKSGAINPDEGALLPNGNTLMDYFTAEEAE